MRQVMRKEFRNLFRHSDAAFGSMDMHGTGCIDINRFMKSIMCKRIEEKSRIKGQGTNQNFAIT